MKNNYDFSKSVKNPYVKHLNPSSEVFGGKSGKIGIFEKPDVVISVS